MWRKGNPGALLVVKQTGAVTVESSSFLKQSEMEPLYVPAIPLLGVSLKKPETLIRKNICIPLFTAALFTIAKIWKQPKRP